jgi:hypothetical protein
MGLNTIEAGSTPLGLGRDDGLGMAASESRALSQPIHRPNRGYPAHDRLQVPSVQPDPLYLGDLPDQGSLDVDLGIELVDRRILIRFRRIRRISRRIRRKGAERAPPVPPCTAIHYRGYGAITCSRLQHELPFIADYSTQGCPHSTEATSMVSLGPRSRFPSSRWSTSTPG